MADTRNKSITGFADIASSVRPIRSVGGDVRVMVLGHSVYLERFVQQVYRSMQYTWSANHFTSPLPFTAEELRKYFVTALHCRVARVTRAYRTDVPFDGWAMPAPFAVVVAGIGEVSTEVPFMRVVPEFNPAYSSELLTRSEWMDLTMRIRSTSDQFTKFLFVDTIEKDRKGRADVMLLYPISPDVEAESSNSPSGGEVAMGTEQRIDMVVSRDEQIDAVSAAVALISGLMPEGWGTLSRVHPFFMPAYSIPGEAVELVIDRMSEVKGA